MTYRKYFLFICLFAGTQLTAAKGFQHEPGTYFTSKDWINIQKMDRTSADVIVLKDGSVINGTFSDFPPIKFSFGNLPLKIKDMAAISVVDKMQVITEDGLSYICEIPDDPFVFLQSVPSVESPLYTTQKAIDPKSVSLVFFKFREARKPQKHQKFFDIEFVSGEKIPASLTTDVIHLSSGIRDGAIKAKEIVDLTIDDGIYGKTKDEAGETHQFDFAFPKDKTLQVQVANTNETLALPWNQINQIKRIVPGVRQKPKSQVLVKKSEDHRAENARLAQQVQALKSEKTQYEDQMRHTLAERKLQEEDVDELHERALQLAHDLNEEQFKNVTLAAELEREHRRATEYKRELSQYKEQYASTSERKTDVESRLVRSETSTEKLKQAQMELFANLEFELTRSRVLKKALKDAQGYIAQSQQMTRQLKRRLRGAKGWSPNLEKEIATLKDRLLDKQKQIGVLNETLVNKEGALTQVEERLDQLEDRLTAEQKDNSSLQDKLEELMLEKSTLQALVESEANEKENLQRAMAEALRKQIASEENARKLEDQLKLAIGQIAQLTETFAKKEDAIEAEQAIQKELNEELIYQKELLASKSEQLEDLKKYINDIEENLFQKTEELETVKEAFAANENDEGVKQELLGHIEELKTENVDLEEKLQDATHEFLTLQQTYQEKEQEIETLKGYASAVEEQVNTLKEAFATRDGDMDALQETYEGVKQELLGYIEGLTQDLSEKDKLVESFKELAENKEQEIEFLRESYVNKESGYDERIDELNTQLKEKTEQIQEHESHLAKKEEAMEFFDQEMVAIRNTLEKRDQDYAQITELYTKLENDYEQANEKSTELEEKIDQLLFQVHEETERRDELDRQLATTVQQLTSSLDALAKAEERVAELTFNQKEMDELITSLKKERDSFEQKYIREREQLIEKTELVERLTDSLNDQRSALNRIEKSHLELVTELESARTEQNRLFNTISGEKPTVKKQKAAPQEFSDVHIVAEGENLNNISMKYYGTSSRWSDIYEANSDVIENVDRIQVGTALVIP